MLPAVLLTLAGALEAPITDVTVFSDRARVVRTAKLTLSGTQELELCTLLDAVDPGSVQVEAAGAEVLRVETPTVTDDALPVDEARALLDAIQKVDDAQARVSAEAQALARQAQQLRRLTPQAPTGEPLKPAPRVSPGGWAAAIDFVTAALEKLDTRQRELTDKSQSLGEERQTLAEKAAQLGGARRRSGVRVLATLQGNGPAKVTVTYVSARARWVPTYDVQLQPDTGQVLVSFAALVSQESGEDWTDAALTLSTAVPATARVAPTFLSWKIGLKERFIPTPTPMSQEVRPPPAAPALRALPKEADRLRAQLSAVARGARASNTVAVSTPVYGGASANLESDQESTGRGGEEEKSYDFSGMSVEGAVAKDERPAPPRKAAKLSAPPSAAPVAQEVVALASASKPGAPPERMSGFSLAPPPGWRAPTFPPDSAAGAAGGYDLSWPSLQPETVPTGKGARRVALFAQTWPVVTERRIFPALFPEAFLVAELKNPSATPLPGGRASLYVGADPAGTAQLALVSPGETFTLPLGIDRAIRPVRNVKVVDSESGLISKDDVSEYTVTIALANPYRTPIALRVVDQVPVTDQKDVEVKLLESSPTATVDAVKGALEWKLTVPASQKKELSFRYTLRRPKGARLQQWEVSR